MDDADVPGSEEQNNCDQHLGEMLVFFMLCVTKVSFFNFCLPKDEIILIILKVCYLLGSLVAIIGILIQVVTSFWIQTHFHEVVEIHSIVRYTLMGLFLLIVVLPLRDPYDIYLACDSPPIHLIALMVFAPIICTTAMFVSLDSFIMSDNGFIYFLLNCFISIFLFDLYIICSGQCKLAFSLVPQKQGAQSSLVYIKKHRIQLEFSKNGEKARLLQEEDDDDENLITDPLIMVHKNGPTTIAIKATGSRHEIFIA